MYLSQSSHRPPPQKKNIIEWYIWYGEWMGDSPADGQNKYSSLIISFMPGIEKM